MPTARRTELPTRKTVSLRSGVPGSGVGGVFQLIYSTSPTFTVTMSASSWTTNDDGEGEGVVTTTQTRQQNPRVPTDRLPCLFRIPANETSESSTSSEITPTSPPLEPTTTGCTTQRDPVWVSDVGHQGLTTTRLPLPPPLPCGVLLHHNGRRRSRNSRVTVRLLRPLTFSLHRGTTMQNHSRSWRMLAPTSRTVPRSGDINMN